MAEIMFLIAASPEDANQRIDSFEVIYVDTLSGSVDQDWWAYNAVAEAMLDGAEVYTLPRDTRGRYLRSRIARVELYLRTVADSNAGNNIDALPRENAPVRDNAALRTIAQRALETLNNRQQ